MSLKGKHELFSFAIYILTECYVSGHIIETKKENFFLEKGNLERKSIIDYLNCTDILEEKSWDMFIL